MRETTFGLRIWNDAGEHEDAASYNELVERLRAEQRYKRALMDIGAAVQAGRVCDDVAWFDTHETLFDFIASVLEPDHREPTPDMFGKFPISRDERRIIEWLRSDAGGYFGDVFALAAQGIETGEHRK